MELSIQKKGLAGNIIRTDASRGTAAAGRKTSVSSAKQDSIEWSKQAIEYVQRSQAEAMEQAQKKRQQPEDSLFSSIEQEDEKTDLLAKQLRTQRLCMKIATRIMRGDRVPPEDMEYLAKNDPEGFKLAMAFRKPKKDPEDCKSVLKDEDKKANEEATSGQMETPETAAGVESPAAAEEGGTPDSAAS